MVTAPVRTPEAVGVKVTLTKQDALALIVVPQEFEAKAKLPEMAKLTPVTALPVCW
jgi:hypothetical protein